MALFRGLKLLPLLLIISRGTKPSSTSYRGLTLGLLGVYSILTSSSLKSIFSRRSLGLFAGFSSFSSEFFSPSIGGSKVLISNIIKRLLSSRFYGNIAIDVSSEFISKFSFLLTTISRVIVIF